MYPDDVLQQIKAQLNIVDVVSKYVNLKKAGRSYQGLCPFHAERTPSFFVNPELNIFKCFGCGVGGDIFKFVQEIEKISFKDAVEKLARQAGVELPKTTQDTLKFKKRKKILRVLDVYSKFFQKVLFTEAGAYARNYLYKRGLNDKQLKEFGIGYAPSDEATIIKFSRLVKFEIQDLIDAGLLTEEKRPRFRYRVMFPLLDNTGKVIGFSGRTLSKSDNVPKYLNSPETMVFRKRFFLFGLYWAKHEISKQDMAILTEGQMDVLSSMKSGVKNIIAPLGTALTETQLMMLKRFTNNIAFAFDNDIAGQKALFRSVVLALKQGFTPYVIKLPSELMGQSIKDIDELISLNASVWKKTSQSAVEFFEDQLTQLKKIQQHSYTEIEPFLMQLLEVLTYATPIRQELVIKQIARVLDISQESIKVKFEDIKNKIQTVNVFEHIVTESKGGHFVQQGSAEYKNSYKREAYNHQQPGGSIGDDVANTYQESAIALNHIREQLEKYITILIVHYPILAFLRELKEDFKELFSDPEYKAFIEYTLKILQLFLQSLSKEQVNQARKGLLDFYEVFLQENGMEFYSDKMNQYFQQTKFYAKYTEIAAMQPPFDNFDETLVKDFLEVLKRFKKIVFKLRIKAILRKLDELEASDNTGANLFLARKLNSDLQRFTKKLQELE